ncbi:hypothetical protein [Cellulomonas sp. URHD0024]|nr:hypothetical protein [Cellulomonas sp. URHD0024]
MAVVVYVVRLLVAVVTGQETGGWGPAARAAWAVRVVGGSA